MNSKLGQRAKETLEAFVPEIELRLKKYFESERGQRFGYSLRQKEVVDKILEHGLEYLLRPQKRARPAFVRYGYALGGKELTNAVWDAAMGVEISHAALLMHDDFMDEDNVRRGGPTTHKVFERAGGGDRHWGEAMAVTAGDVLLCLGFELVVGTGNQLASRQMLRAIANTGFGQAYDLALEKFAKWSEKDVIDLHRAKTGLYTYENPLLVGMYLAGITDDKVIGVIRKYADYGGVAFQLQDDILGVYGTPEKTGKSADSDLKQGKCTLMVLKAYELGTSEQQQVVRRVWGNSLATREELDAAKLAMQECGAYAYNKKVAKEYAQQAVEYAAKLRKFKLNEEAIDYIQGIAEYMVEREV